ncbi:MAG TPA: hypothetical protein VHV31_15325 [Nitrolancea sp.]|nr:hypothetical protein [Nitrolancea sp.]
MVDAVRRQLDLIMNAYGYNLYEKKNRARADDLIVRETAAGALGAAANSLRTLRTEYRRKFIPPLTRDNPDPPRARLDELAEITHLQERVANLETRIRSMPVPVQDRAWEKFRQEKQTLNDLLMRDYNMIVPCQNLREQLRVVKVDQWSDDTITNAEELIDQIDEAIRSRADFLQLSG